MDDSSQLNDPQSHMNLFGIGDEEFRVLAQYWRLHTVAETCGEHDWLPFDPERWANFATLPMLSASMGYYLSLDGARGSRVAGR